MRTMIFIIVVVAFAVITLVNRKPRKNNDNPELPIPVHPDKNGYDDSEIRVLAYNPRDFKDSHELSENIETDVSHELYKLLPHGYNCKVEFNSAGYYLIVIIRGKQGVRKIIKKGGIQIWRKQ